MGLGFGGSRRLAEAEFDRVAEFLRTEGVTLKTRTGPFDYPAAYYLRRRYADQRELEDRNRSEAA